MESSTDWLAGETKGRQIPSAEGGGPAREICQISVLYEKKYFCQYDVDVVEDIDRFEEKNMQTPQTCLCYCFLFVE